MDPVAVQTVNQNAVAERYVADEYFIMRLVAPKKIDAE